MFYFLNLILDSPSF